MQLKKQLKKINHWSNRREWIIFLILLVIFLRLPSLFTPHYYGDEEIYFVMGRAWKTGVHLYADMFDHKPPLIYVMAGIFSTVYLFRLALMIWMIIHTWIFWQLSKLLFIKEKKYLSYISSLLFVGLTSLPMLEGNIVNAELMMMMPISLALLMLLKIRKDRWQVYFKVGLVAGIGWLFKIPVVLDAVAIGLYWFVYRENNFIDGIKKLFSKYSVAYFFGFAIPLLSSFGYYFLKGDGKDYLSTVWSMNLAYVSSWETSSWTFNPFQSGLVMRTLILFGILVWIYLVRKKIKKTHVLVWMWLSFSYFGALLSARPYPHYLLQPVVPLALALPLLITVESVWEWIIIGYLSIWGVLSIKQVGFWWYPNLKIYQNFTRLLVGDLNKRSYIESFDGAKRNYAVANYLNERMGVKDRLFIWGSDTAIYNLTNKLPAGGRYMVNFHIQDLNQYDYVINNLNKTQPKFIVVLPNTPKFAQLNELLEREYSENIEIEKVEIFKRELE